MSNEKKLEATAPSGDQIEVIWTGERLLLFMTSADGSRLFACDSHVAELIEQGLFEVEDTQQVP